MSRAALDLHWKNLLDRVAQNAEKHKSFTSIAIDSWEVHHQNWSDGFEKLFEERCGYDLIPKLLCLTGRVLESTEYTERVLWDPRNGRDTRSGGVEKVCLPEVSRLGAFRKAYPKGASQGLCHLEPL